MLIANFRSPPLALHLHFRDTAWAKADCTQADVTDEPMEGTAHIEGDGGHYGGFFQISQTAKAIRDFPSR